MHEVHGLVDRPGRGHQDLHLRRRHARDGAAGHPQQRPHRGHQSGHAAPGHPAAPHPVGEALREPALRGGRRGAPVPRRLRQPRGQRAAAAAADRAVLRGRPAVHLLLGHHRQPAGAGRAPDRAGGGVGRATTARRGARSTSSSTTRRWSTAELGIRQSVVKTARAIAERFLAAGVPDDRLRPQPHAGRAAADLPGEGRPHGWASGAARCAATAAATCRTSGGPSSRACATAASARWSRPTPWSWASTSAGWTSASWPATPAPWPAPGSRRAGPAGGRTSAPWCWWPRAVPADQYVINNPDYFFGRSPEHATLDPDNLVILHEPPEVRGLRAALRRGRSASAASAWTEILDYLAEQRRPAPQRATATTG